MNILIADDSSAMRKLIAAVLEEAGHTVKAAENGQLALEHADWAEFMITDINMPVMTGFELTKKVRELGHTYPILCLTTESERDKKDLGKEVGANGWIVKPFTPESLLKTVKAVIDRMQSNA
jgi:two-component system chemotaxis response regulator CheY